MDKVFIVAEAGVNHNGSAVLAEKMVDAAVLSGVDAIKFQIFNPESFVSRLAPKAEYQKKTTGKKENQLSMLEKLKLSDENFLKIIGCCRKKGIGVIFSPFDLRSVEFVKNSGTSIVKIPSGEITDLPYLRTVGSLGKSIIMSTGMANLREVASAVRVLIESGSSKESITLLHCNTEYPSPFADVNLLAMIEMKTKLKMKTGYSDHTAGIEACIAAAALGARVIEKHFTLDRNMPGPDHSSSIEPDELKRLVNSVRNVEKAMGTGKKEPAKSELKNIPVVRKSIVAAKDIRKGEYFTEKNITVKRPGTGLNPMKWDSVIGRKAKQNFSEDEMITL